MGSSANLEILEKVLCSFARLPYRVICPLVDLAIIHEGEHLLLRTLWQRPSDEAS